MSWDDPTIQRTKRDRSDVIVFDYQPEYVRDNTSRFEGEVDAGRARYVYENAWRDLPEEEGEPTIASSGDAVCHWLYKNMVMDARGRVMPCCAPPGRAYDLVLANFEGNGRDADVFNSGKYEAARLGFVDKARFDRKVADLELEAPPHCVNCTWAKGRSDVNIEAESAADHLREYTNGLLDSAACRILGDW